jgi:hypothetical protein
VPSAAEVRHACCLHFALLVDCGVVVFFCRVLTRAVVLRAPAVS